MSLRIAFDLDGVLADMDGALRREQQRLFGQGQSGPDSADEVGVEAAAPEAKALTGAQNRQLWRAVAAVENFWETLAELEPGVISSIAEHARDRRWEVIFLTSRPETFGATPQLQTQRWLRRHGFPLPSVFVVTGSRGKIAEALDLDVVVDDLPGNCLDVVTDSHATSILIWRRGPESIPARALQQGIRVLGSVTECLAALSSLEADEPRPTLLSLARSMLRLGHAK